MDTSVIPINISAVYDILLTCASLLASSWGVVKVIQLFRRR